MGLQGAPRLKREMSGLGGMVLTLTGLSPSIGVFVAAPVVMTQSGSFVIAAILLACLLGVLVAGVYAELGSAFPNAGGDFVLIGSTLGPTLRFGVLAGVLFGAPAALALSALGVADFLRVLFPQIGAVPCALACVVVVTVLAALSIRLNAWVTGLFLVVEIASLIAIVVLGFGHPHRGLLGPVVHPVMAGAHGGLVAPSLMAMGAGVTGAIYVMNGYGQAVSYAEEIVGARSKLVWVIFGALGLGALCILPPLCAVIVGAPDLQRLLASSTPLQDFVADVGGPVWARAIGLGVALAILNAMITIALGGGRSLYATAREGAWSEGLNRALSRIHVRHGSPWIATLVVGGAALLFCLAPQRLLVMLAGVGNAIGYGLLALGVIVGRRTGATAASRSPMGFVPLAPAVVVVAAVGMIGASLIDRPSRPAVAASLVILSAGAIYWRLVASRSGRWAHHDPDEEETPPLASLEAAQALKEAPALARAGVVQR